MKKIISMLAVAAFLCSVNSFAQEVAKDSKTKTEKTCAKGAKKCENDKKGGCCSGKKAEKKS